MYGLILPTNLKYAPYVQNYISILNEKKVEFELVFWDKRNIEKAGECVYKNKIKSTDKPSWRKVCCYLGFIHFVRRRIKKKKYEKLIIFTLAPGLFLTDMLCGKYKDAYILDVRDDTPLRKFMGGQILKIAKNATYLIASSPCYSDWLGRKATLCHNSDISTIDQHLNYIPKKLNTETICIGYAGMMREGSINSFMINALLKDNRFSFLFYGPHNQQMQELIQIAGDRDNCRFPGIYEKNDIYDIYRKYVTVVNILRENNTVNAEALPNKLYEAVIAGVPVIVARHNKAVSNYVENYNLGVVLEELNELKDANKLYDNISKFDYKKYCDGRQAFLQKVKDDLSLYEKQVINFVK